MTWRRAKRRGRRPAESGIGVREPATRRLSWDRRVEITAALLGIVAIGFALGPKIEGAFDGGEDARLEIAEITVSNPPAAYSSSAAGLEQDPATEPTVAATVRNRGEETAWIEEARITVVDSARLSICVNQGGGDVPQSKRYRISLPDFPRAERELVRRDLHVEVQPGHGVRPVLSFQKDSPGTTNLYAIRVQLVADPGHQVIDAGRFVIGVPEPVSRSGQILPEADNVLLSEATVPGQAYSTWCFRHNLEGTRRVVSRPGRRSDYVGALARMQLAPAWSQYADQRPPQLMVEDLLSEDGFEAPMYALDAARQTGDADYEEAVRERVIRLLMQRGEEELDEYPAAAVEDAKRLLSLERSAAAVRLLARAKAERRAEEEREEEEREREAPGF
ncbi:MAG TPA: hypothetical protein VF125_07840 [Solirubrobacterales bacterium]